MDLTTNSTASTQALVWTNDDVYSNSTLTITREEPTAGVAEAAGGQTPAGMLVPTWLQLAGGEGDPPATKTAPYQGGKVRGVDRYGGAYA